MLHISKIYWHFTGSPENIDWHSIISPNQINQPPKPDNIAFEILLKILDTKKLIASATEQIFKGINTDKFCCVTDIPLKDLKIHSNTYGKIAVGFSSKIIHNSFFNPVLYISRNSIPSHRDASGKKYNLNLPALPEFETFFLNCGFSKSSDEFWSIPARMDTGSADKTLLPKYFINHLKITKFSDKDGDSFYQEREWRKINDFHFEYKDIEAIIVPKELLDKLYRYLKEKKMSIPLLTWDVIEKT
jgi:hypothetical protein